MTTKPYLIIAAISVAFIFLIVTVNDTAARGGGGGGGGARAGGAHGGGFSRGGPAASGSLSAGSRQAGARSSSASASTMAGRSQTAQTASRSQAAQTASTNRAGTREGQQQASSENVGSRQEGRTDRTESRQEGATERSQGRQETAQHYDDHGHYYSDGDDWDDGEVAAVAIGAALVGGAVGYAAGQSSTEQTVVYTTPPASGSGGLPCTPNTAVVNGVTYYQCGTTWYTQAYGSNGVMYMPVPAP